MKKESLTIQYERYEDPSELAPDEKRLLEAALEATENAYAPFSVFFVGAALLLDDGEIVKGCNQENRAFPSGLCAERTALFAAGAAGKGSKIRKLAVTARSPKVEVNVPPTPCGACRQVMAEYEIMAGEPMVLIMRGASGDILRVTGIADSFLPFGFNIEF